MDLQTRKLNFIKDFLKVENEQSIMQLEQLLRQEMQINSGMKPMTLKQFKNRIDQSTDDSNKGKLTEHNTLISETEKWS